MMKRLILTLFLITGTVCADEQKVHRHLSYPASVTLLQSIESDAIILGKGKQKVYVFVDPLCPHSRKFITMVSHNRTMLSKYRYAIFLYSIPRLKSTDVVSAVYMSPHPKDTLLQVMVEGKVSSAEGDEGTTEKISRINTIAEEMDVYKRPYLFIKK